MKVGDLYLLIQNARSINQMTLGESILGTIMLGCLEELQAIREATETEAVEDAEPGPFQTLNGPRLKLTEEEAAMELLARQGLEGP